MESSLQILDKLLGSTTVASFLTEYWERRHLHATDSDVSGFQFDEADLEARIRFSPISRGSGCRLVFHKHNVPASAFCEDGSESEVDYDKFLKMQQAGITAIANLAHNFSNRLLSSCRLLEQCLSARVHVNLYATPPSGRGFHAHYDTHDVFIVQVSGSKEWRLYHEAVKYPFPAMRGKYMTDTLPEPEPLTLRAGEMLYVPRGHVHAARASQGEHSVHLTVGVTPLTWADLLCEAVNTVSWSDASLRQGLPPRTLTNPDSVQNLQTTLLGRLDSLRTDAHLPEAIASLQHKKRIGDLLPAGRVPDSNVIGNLSPSMLLRASEELSFSTDAEQLTLTTNSSEPGLPLKQRYRSTWEWISQQTQFTPEQLSKHLPPNDNVLLFVRYLLINACLRSA